MDSRLLILGAAVSLLFAALVWVAVSIFRAVRRPRVTGPAVGVDDVQPPSLQGAAPLDTSLDGLKVTVSPDAPSAALAAPLKRDSRPPAQPTSVHKPVEPDAVSKDVEKPPAAAAPVSRAVAESAPARSATPSVPVVSESGLATPPRSRPMLETVVPVVRRDEPASASEPVAQVAHEPVSVPPLVVATTEPAPAPVAAVPAPEPAPLPPAPTVAVAVPAPAPAVAAPAAPVPAPEPALPLPAPTIAAPAPEPPREAASVPLPELLVPAPVIAPGFAPDAAPATAPPPVPAQAPAVPPASTREPDLSAAPEIAALPVAVSPPEIAAFASAEAAAPARPTSPSRPKAVVNAEVLGELTDRAVGAVPPHVPYRRETRRAEADFTLSAPVEMWFGDSRVGVKHGSKTWQQFRRYADVLLADLQEPTQRDR